MSAKNAASAARIQSNTKSSLNGSPQVHRSQVHGKIRDPKFIAGVALVILSVSLGLWITSSSDSRTQVWAMNRALAAGSVISFADLEQVPVYIDELNAYVPIDADVVGMKVTRDVGADELLPASIVSQTTQTSRLVTIPVGLEHGAASVNRGDLVDIYQSSRDAADGSQPSRLVLAKALVAEVGLDEVGSGQVPVSLDLDPSQVAAVVGASRGGVIDLVKVSGSRT